MASSDTAPSTTTEPIGTAVVREGPCERTVLRVAGGAFVLSAVLLLLLDPGQGPDLETVTGQQALGYFTESLATRQWLGVGAVLALAAWIVSIVAFRQAAVRRQPRGMWGDIVVAAGLLVAVNWMLLGAVVGIPTIVDLESTTPEAAQIWYLLDALDGSFGNVAMVAQLLVAAAVGCCRAAHAPAAPSRRVVRRRRCGLPCAVARDRPRPPRQRVDRVLLRGVVRLRPRPRRCGRLDARPQPSSGGLRFRGSPRPDEADPDAGDHVRHAAGGTRTGAVSE
jgi:hypothetical protein